jgi:hypothetical protein
MIQKIFVCYDNKLILTKFMINIVNSKIIINPYNILEQFKIAVFNKYNGITYVPIYFPLELIICKNYVFNPYIILSSYNIKLDDTFDFFYQIEKCINTKFNLKFYDFNYLLKHSDLFFTLINNYNIDFDFQDIKKISLENFSGTEIDINVSIKSLWFNINIIKLYCIYSIITNKKNNIINIDNLKILKYNINSIQTNLTLIEYLKSKNFTIDYVIFQTFINLNFTSEIIKILGFKFPDYIINYYEVNNKLSNLKTIFSINDFDILKYNSYSNDYFKYITLTYSDNVIDILSILFKFYNYPLKSNRHDIDNIFDYILYFSLYNYKSIFITPNVLNSAISNIIPYKLKNLYIILLKTLIQIINNNFESIMYNQKFYNDYLYKNIIKLFLSSDSNKLSIIYFKELIDDITFNKIKNIIVTNITLINISNKLSWINLYNKFDYLNYFIKNNNYIFYQNRFNKNIIHDNFDNKIKKIIENPFDMYKFLKNENDFIKWTYIISDKILQLYYAPITFLDNDLKYIGILIYLLINVTDQDLKNCSYINFINFCNLHNNLILYSNRINLKIKIFFPYLKCIINLGFLAKHLNNFIIIIQ